MSTSPLGQELAHLAGYSPAEFVAHRRRLIAQVLQPDGVANEHLLELQQSIDQAMAVGATPKNRLRQLHGRLDEHLEALAALTRRLEEAVNPSGIECA